MSIFNGMESLGLGDLKDLEIFEEKESKGTVRVQQKAEKKAESEIKEEDFLFQKRFTCPVCDKEFQQLMVRDSKAKSMGHDKDLRPLFYGIDTQKYDIVLCNSCGYARMQKLHEALPKSYRNMLREKIMPNYKPMELGETKITYDEAVMRYKLALMNAVVRQSKQSERAYITLKLSWIYRGMREELTEDDPEYKEKTEQFLAQEKEYQKLALEGFTKAKSSETAPYAGLSDLTLDYLLAILNMEAENYSDALKLIHSVLQNPAASTGQKQKGYEIIQEIKDKVKNN